ncbi:MAG: B12-binding domain-containing radical SAM protein [Candidatus Omnitrophica bacterium]|nr:B12-binding domain-containing radical SAM protein [Candidatus Omnitrophota bacterium]
MRVLLINPQFEFKKFGSFTRFMEPMPSIGLAYIASVLVKNGIEIEIIDDFVLRLGAKGILSVIKKKKFDIVGISCLTPSAPITFSIAAAIKSYDSKILIVLGNIHAVVFAGDILKKEAVDVIVHGEGEYTMLELAKAVASGADLAQVKGISFKQDGKIVHTPPRELIENLDELPYPQWQLFPFTKYAFLPFMDVKKPGLSILGSRGCPYRCRFCSLPNTGTKYRERDPKKIADEIEYVIHNFPVKQISFVDPIFPLSKKVGLEFSEEMVRRKLHNKIVWTCETRIDRMDRELLKAMRQAGCRRIMYGLESGVQALLDNIGKGFSVDYVKRIIKLTQQEDISVAGVFMIGLPGETRAMTQQTIDFAKQIDLDFAKFAITVPFPGSQLYEDLTRTGELKRQDWENFTTFNTNPKELVYVPGNMKPEELIEMQRKGHRDFYLRPEIIFRQLFKIRTISIKDLFSGFFSLFSHGLHKNN